MYYKMEFLCRQKNGFLVIRTFDVVLNTIPEKSRKYAVNDQYLTISISLRIFIAQEFDQFKIERIQGLIFKTRVDPICSTLLEV